MLEKTGLSPFGACNRYNFIKISVFSSPGLGTAKARSAYYHTLTLGLKMLGLGRTLYLLGLIYVNIGIQAILFGGKTVCLPEKQFFLMKVRMILLF